MKLPATIQVGPHTYTVEAVDDLLRSEDRRGDSDPDAHRIRIAAGLPDTLAADTLLHEVLHCVMSMFDHGCKPSDEEVLVTGMAPWLLAVLRDNPKLTDLLMEA